MSTGEYVFVAYATILGLAVGYLLVKVLILNRDLAIMECKKNIERGRAVYWYRSYVYKVHPEKYKELPSYKEMAESDKEFEFID